MCYLPENIMRHPDLADYIASKFDELYYNEVKKPLSELYVSVAKFKNEQLKIINKLPNDISDEIEYELDGYILNLLQGKFYEIDDAVRITESLDEQQAHSGDDSMIYF